MSKREEIIAYRLTDKPKWGNSYKLCGEDMVSCDHRAHGDKYEKIEPQILAITECKCGEWESKKTKANIDLQFEDGDGTEFFKEYADKNKLLANGCFCDVLNLKNANKGNDTDEKLSLFKYHNILLAYIIEFRDEFNFAYRYYFSKNLSAKEKGLLNLKANEILNESVSECKCERVREYCEKESGTDYGDYDDIETGKRKGRTELAKYILFILSENEKPFDVREWLKEKGATKYGNQYILYLDKINDIDCNFRFENEVLIISTHQQRKIIYRGLSSVSKSFFLELIKNLNLNIK